MKCTSKEQDTCNVEKMGCKGCFYEENELESFIEQMTKVRPEILNDEALKLFNTIIKALDERDNLIKERDYYKARYLEFNNGVIEAGKILNKER